MIPYSTVMTVVDSWDTIKRDPAWTDSFGPLLFDKYVKTRVVAWCDTSVLWAVS